MNWCVSLTPWCLKMRPMKRCLWPSQPGGDLNSQQSREVLPLDIYIYQWWNKPVIQQFMIQVWFKTHMLYLDLSMPPGRLQWEPTWPSSRMRVWALQAMQLATLRSSRCLHRRKRKNHHLPNRFLPRFLLALASWRKWWHGKPKSKIVLPCHPAELETVLKREP